MTPELRSTWHDDVLVLGLDRPRRKNALSKAVLRAITTAVRGIDPDATAGVVLYGCGDDFSAGADFSELTGTAEDVHFDDVVEEATDAVRSCPRPVVSAISGACLGAALDLALNCDVRVADETAFLQVPAVRLGILYNPAAIARMARVLRRDTVSRLLLLGERFDARSALEAGLVSQVVVKGDALSQARALLSGQNPAAVRAGAATKNYLLDLEAEERDHSYWEEVRRGFLESPERLAIIEAAHARHSRDEGEVS